MKILQADSMGSRTSVGYITMKFPIDKGNCFSLGVKKKYYSIINFGYENLQELLKQKVIEWPIQIKEIRKGIAVIHDVRIPHNWYWDRFCTCCCPKDLLPMSQQLERERDIASGALKILGNTEIREIKTTKRALDGKLSISQDDKSLKPLKGWKDDGDGYIYANYVPQVKDKPLESDLIIIPGYDKKVDKDKYKVVNIPMDKETQELADEAFRVTNAQKKKRLEEGMKAIEKDKEKLIKQMVKNLKRARDGKGPPTP